MKRIFLFVFVLIVISSCTITSNVVYENDLDIQVYFCPEDKCQDKIIELVDKSSNIKCAFYELNLPELIDKLKEKNAEPVTTLSLQHFRKKWKCNFFGCRPQRP